METQKEKRFSKIFIVAFTMLLAIFVLTRAFVSEGFSIWYFKYINMTEEYQVESRTDSLSFNLEKDISDHDATAKTYDVYFMAQNIDIDNFIEIDERVNGIEQYTFKNNSDSHGLYYTNSEYGLNSYEPRLGTWDENFSTDSSISSNLFKKFENVSSLSSAEIASIGEPYSKMVDGNSTSSAYWNLVFLTWTMDVLKLKYDVVYKVDNSTQNPIIDPDTNLPTVLHEEINNASIYIRNPYHGQVEGNLKVYGTYPTKDFEIAYPNALFESYDSYAKNIDGRRCLFFYPIYSLGKDSLLNSVRKQRLQLEDCTRVETDRVLSTDRYFTYDCEYTDLLHQNALFTDYVEYWPNEMNQKYVTKYKCFRLSNRLVTQEMVNKNAIAKTLSQSDTRDVTGNFNLTAQQERQTFYGEYVFTDISRNRGGWDGIKMGYLLDEDNELLNINYKTGMFNIYIFTRQEFIDPPGNYTANPSRFDFTAQQKAEIDAIMRTNNINVDRTVSCPAYTKFVGNNSWNRNDGRGHYIVFEEIITTSNTSDYNSETMQPNFSYSKNANASNSFVSNGPVEYDLTSVTSEISTDNVLQDLGGNYITLTYPNYYFTNVIDGEQEGIYKQNIGKGANSPNYATPTYKYFLSNGGSIYKNFASSEHLETMLSAVQAKEEEASRIKVTLNDNTTYTIKQLQEDNSKAELYNSIMSQLENVYLLKVKDSGQYRICVYCYKNNNNEYEFDVWVSSPKGYIVTIYDKTDFANADIVKDVDGVMTSREWASDNFSFIADITYLENSDLIYRDELGANARAVEYRIKDNKTIPTNMQPYVTTRRQQNYIKIDDLLKYLDDEGLCLLDASTGRFITKTNIENLPYVVNGDVILQVIDKPDAIA